jgi:hypothetical protein
MYATMLTTLFLYDTDFHSWKRKALTGFSLFFAYFAYCKKIKKEVIKMFYVIVQTGCMIIIAIAAVKYLMPDIRNVCRMIADSGESKEKKKKTEKEKKDIPAAAEEKAPGLKEKEEKEPENIEITGDNDNPETITPSEDTEGNGATDSTCQAEKEEGEFPEWEE